LILNHFSSRYSGDLEDESIKIMEEIRRLAETEFLDPELIIDSKLKAEKVVTARDFMTVTI
jgi:molybdopterin biosynthesis enzyme MoaB